MGVMKALRLNSIPLVFIAVLFVMISDGRAATINRISVFNFNAANIEATGYNTTISQMLIASLGTEPGYTVLDKKELESFLALNDLQQNDSVENAVQIGTRLGINFIVIGNVEKRGPIIVINCKLISVEKKRPILVTQARALGDAGLVEEVRKLHRTIVEVITKDSPEEEKPPSIPGPTNLKKRAGNKSIYLFGMNRNVYQWIDTKSFAPLMNGDLIP